MSKSLQSHIRYILHRSLNNNIHFGSCVTPLCLLVNSLSTGPCIRSSSFLSSSATTPLTQCSSLIAPSMARVSPDAVHVVFTTCAILVLPKILWQLESSPHLLLLSRGPRKPHVITKSICLEVSHPFLLGPHVVHLSFLERREQTPDTKTVRGVQRYRSKRSTQSSPLTTLCRSPQCAAGTSTCITSNHNNRRAQVAGHSHGHICDPKYWQAASGFPKPAPIILRAPSPSACQSTFHVQGRGHLLNYLVEHLESIVKTSLARSRCHSCEDILIIACRTSAPLRPPTRPRCPLRSGPELSLDQYTSQGLSELRN